MQKSFKKIQINFHIECRVRWNLFISFDRLAICVWHYIGNLSNIRRSSRKHKIPLNNILGQKKNYKVKHTKEREKSNQFALFPRTRCRNCCLPILFLSIFHFSQILFFFEFLQKILSTPRAPARPHKSSRICESSSCRWMPNPLIMLIYEATRAFLLRLLPLLLCCHIAECKQNFIPPFQCTAHSTEFFFFRFFFSFFFSRKCKLIDL